MMPVRATTTVRSATSFRRLAVILSALVVAALPLMIAIAWLWVVVDGNTPSRVIGTVAHGRIEHAHVIPPWGPGYVTYSFLGSALGRQYVDGRVRDTMLATFSVRSRTEGGRTFVVGETGWPWGGRFRPHRSHHTQAGLGTARRALPHRLRGRERVRDREPFTPRRETRTRTGAPGTRTRSTKWSCWSHPTPRQANMVLVSLLYPC